MLDWTRCCSATDLKNDTLQIVYILYNKQLHNKCVISNDFIEVYVVIILGIAY